MKSSSFLLVFSCFFVSPVVATAHAPSVGVVAQNGPVTVEVTTRYTDRAEALEAAKTALATDEFVIDGSMGERGFMAKRTTDSEAVYYVGDISASEQDGKVALTIVLIAFGEGDVNLQEVGQRLEKALG